MGTSEVKQKKEAGEHLWLATQECELALWNILKGVGEDVVVSGGGNLCEKDHAYFSLPLL